MIINGNYKFLDFASIKDQLLDVCSEFFGKQNKDYLREKIKNITYVPFLDRNAVYEYYNKYLSKFMPEIVKNYGKITKTKVPNYIAKLLWTPDKGDGNGNFSLLLTALQEGKFLENKTYLDPQLLSYYTSLRKGIYETLGWQDDPDRYEKLVAMGKNLHKAIEMLYDAHPCDVFEDVRKTEQNESVMLQSFVSEISNVYTPMMISARDKAMISSPNFSYDDIVDLGCKDRLFGETLHDSGLISAFTTKSDDILVHGNWRQQQEILKNRIKYYMSVVSEQKPHELMFLTLDELLGYDMPDDRKDFTLRMYNELNQMTKIYPGIFVPNNIADKIEQLRTTYANLTRHGLNYSRFVDRRVNNHIIENLTAVNRQYVTVSDFENHDGSKPISTVFFNETEKYSADGRLLNLLHEIVHCIGNAPAVKYAERPYAYYLNGLDIRVVALGEQGQVDLDNGIVKNFGLDNLKENITQRMAREMLSLYLQRHPNPFGNSDLPYSDQSYIMPSEYDVWNPITDDFYHTYKANLKECMANPNYQLFYDHPEFPVNKYDELKFFLNDKIKRLRNPSAFSDKGVLDFRKVVQLGGILNEFVEKVAPVVEEHSIIENNGMPKMTKSLPLKTRNQYATLLTRASKVFAKMLRDEVTVSRHKEEVGANNIEVISTIRGGRNSTTLPPKETPKRTTSHRGSRVVDQIEPRDPKNPSTPVESEIPTQKPLPKTTNNRLDSSHGYDEPTGPNL